jgi:hypothetical protein
MLDAQKRLQDADHRITEWRTLIGRQKRRIAEMQKGGYSAVGSITLLREMEVSLNSMCHERKLIQRRIELHRKHWQRPTTDHGCAPGRRLGEQMREPQCQRRASVSMRS